MHPKDGAAQPLALRLLIVPFIRRRRHKQILAHKLHARRIPRRQPHPPHHRTRCPVNAKHHALAVKSLPHVALGVDAQAVGLRRAGRVVVVHAAPAHGTGDGVVVEGEELPRGRVREIHGAVVGRPAHAVGDGEVGNELLGRVFGEEEETA